MDAGTSSTGILILSLTNVCGCDCVFCDLPSAPKKPELSLELLIAALENPPGAETWEEVNLTGGDPLVVPSARRLMAEVLERRHRFSTLSLCSAGVPSRAAIAGLLSIPEDVELELYVSLDGVDAVHDQIRGRAGAFQEVLAFLRAGSARLRTRVALNCVINARNVHCLDEVADLAERLGLPIGYSVVAETDHYIASKALYPSVRLGPAEAEAAIEFLGRRSQHPFDGDLKRLLRGGLRNTPCRLLEEGFLLTPDGAVAVCGSDRRMILTTVKSGADALSGWQTAIEARHRWLAQGAAAEPCARCTTNCYSWRMADVGPVG